MLGEFPQLVPMSVHESVVGAPVSVVARFQWLSLAKDVSKGIDDDDDDDDEVRVDKASFGIGVDCTAGEKDVLPVAVADGSVVIAFKDAENESSQEEVALAADGAASAAMSAGKGSIKAAVASAFWSLA